jgi:2-polyprenyl-6-methoxyphenol hydroxylase-like FAD-dependent oxidoreductase/predicted DsbA family dithiol-disulfide isomerase
MKAVIIGGGIAGLTLGIFLHKNNVKVVICERTVGRPVRGHAFLMHTNGLAILNELSAKHKIVLPGKKINTYSLRRPEGHEIKHVQLNSWQCIKRTELISFLYSLFPKDKIKEGRKFSHFVYENGKAVAAAFFNGDLEYGDIFVGADGGNSKVRESIFGEVDFTPVEVKEIVGICTNKQVAIDKAGAFTKFQHAAVGLAFGLIPTSGDEFVWFMQYDPSVWDVSDKTPEGLEDFCKKLSKSFPPIVSDILASNDFSTSYIWDTRDFDLLPTFHKENVVLIGDAAHLALPFTSAGTTNAIIDAETLAQTLGDSLSYEKAFELYYRIRSEEISNHIQLGRDLKNLFLNPQDQKDDDIPVPLIPLRIDYSIENKKKPIQIIYFTDPICSTCWIIQPSLRKLQLEYGDYINIEYRMGGLLPSWDDYNKGKIKQPLDAAKHWEEVCACHQMPLDGDIWIEDPLKSSFPPSIAFKAAQMQDSSRALLFLRRIKEMVFMEKKNIIKSEYLEEAAFEVGLDSARLLRDIEGKAQQNFINDLASAEKLGVASFPTLIFSDNKNNQITLKGFQPYENFEEIIYKFMPSANKKVINPDPVQLFTQFSTLTNKEFELLSNLKKADADRYLNKMFEDESIGKFESKNGIIWISRLAACES